MGSPLRILVVTDIHYATCAADAVGPEKRHCLRGRELLAAALADAHGRFDVLALLGDMLNNGASQQAAAALGDLRDEIDRLAADIPRLVVPGNHDEDPERLLDILGGRAGRHEIGGVRFVACADSFDGILATRAESDRRALAEIAARPGGPIVVCQHNPLHPPIEDDYPYMLTNREDVMADYARAGVLLSISGHYHAGQPLHTVDGVAYLTAPALCEAPFPYTIVTLHGQNVSVQQYSTPEL